MARWLASTFVVEIRRYSATALPMPRAQSKLLYATADAILLSAVTLRCATILRSAAPILRPALARRSGAPLLPKAILLPAAVLRSAAIRRSASLRSATILRSADPTLRSAPLLLSCSLELLPSAFILLSRLFRTNAVSARVLQERVAGHRRDRRSIPARSARRM